MMLMIAYSEDRLQAADDHHDADPDPYKALDQEDQESGCGDSFHPGWHGVSFRQLRHSLNDGGV
ncbi:MAG: hypothetical protein IID28_00865 [Planctomycetes bacterium]|nr:hypothetical protein [Planctomycetota bacterium]